MSQKSKMPASAASESGPDADLDKAIARVNELRDRVERELRAVGFVWRGTQLVPPDGDPKNVARLLHATQRQNVLRKHADFVNTWEGRLMWRFANGDEVDPNAIAPRVFQVATDEDAALFRYASLSWSVPVSQGYGRRTRFLVVDDHNDRLIGIFALGDPVFNLRVRDTVIGWSHEQRQDRLYNVFDAFVLGAVEPYRALLAGKLVALATVCEEVLEALTEKYRGTTTHIQGKEKIPRPVLITTTSSLGRSSIYNRLRMPARRVFNSVGYTEGFGHFQFSDDLFADLMTYARAVQQVRGNKYGEGPNWKIRSLRFALESLGLPGDLLRHGLRREVFLAPLGIGWRAFLRGETDGVQWYRYRLEEISAHYRDRWAAPRAASRPDFKSHLVSSTLISTELARLDFSAAEPASPTSARGFQA